MSKKILFLHGYTQSGDLFYKKTSALRKSLQKNGYSSFFPTAPIHVPVPDSADPDERAVLEGHDIDSSSYGWWIKDPDTGDFLEIDTTWDLLKSFIEKEGPFDGVIGFSQGAALSGMLCNKLMSLCPEHPRLKFGVFYSGFRSTLPQHEELYPIYTSSLHVLGSLDTVVSEERSVALFDACDPATRTVYTHPGGHFVPNSKDSLNVVVGWILSTIEASEAKNQKPSDDDEEDWEDEDFNIGGGM
ncbi:serine hydrolase FSH [Lipomyces oligophaga]|uniref:serine hydrolase FSH n=1 Tax=Lipomyces oligophaga TaxID=45792 RepID=UPI0034CF42C1